MRRGKNGLGPKFPTLDEVSDWCGLTPEAREALEEIGRKAMLKPLPVDLAAISRVNRRQSAKGRSKGS